MGWSIGFDSYWNRDIGYGVPAYCDHPKCKTRIDRGLAHVCGAERYGGEKGCGLYFCGKHQIGSWQRCGKCRYYKSPYKAKPDHPTWIKHKMTHESWAEWKKTDPNQREG